MKGILISIVMEKAEGMKEKSNDYSILLKNILPAVQFYEGDPNNSFLSEEVFDEKTRKSTKAYVTLNTLLEDEKAEEQRFKEGKLQIPGLITPEGIRKILDVYKGFYQFCMQNPANYNAQLCAMKRCSEVKSPFIRALTSTTKQSPKEIYKQGYGDKVGLALCYYRLHPGALAFDYEKLGELYAKKQEREVLLMPGNQWHVRNVGQDERYLGKDGKPAEIYEIDVVAPNFDKILQVKNDFEEEDLYNPKRLELVRNIYEEINKNIGGEFPKIPDEYWKWKQTFQQTVYSLLRDINLSYTDQQRRKETGNKAHYVV